MIVAKVETNGKKIAARKGGIVICLQVIEQTLGYHYITDLVNSMETRD